MATDKNQALSYLYSSVFICGSLFPQHLLGGGHQIFRFEAVLALQFLERGGRAESFHAENAAVYAGVAFPAKRGRLLDGDARRNGGREYARAVLVALLLENVPRRHGDHARPDAFSQKRVVRIGGENDLAARRYQNDLRLAFGRVRQHVSAAREAGGGRESLAVERRQGLA